jgi:hypothetical protein
MCDRWKAFLESALSDQGDCTPVSSPVHVSYDLLQDLVSLLQPIDGGLGVQDFNLASRKMIQALPKYRSLIVLLVSLRSSKLEALSDIERFCLYSNTCNLLRIFGCIELGLRRTHVSGSHGASRSACLCQRWVVRIYSANLFANIFGSSRIGVTFPE